jgi:hypothetical protein
MIMQRAAALRQNAQAQQTGTGTCVQAQAQETGPVCVCWRVDRASPANEPFLPAVVNADLVGLPLSVVYHPEETLGVLGSRTAFHLSRIQQTLQDSTASGSQLMFCAS